MSVALCIGAPYALLCALQRLKRVALKDKRVRAVTEVLRLIKFSDWEDFSRHEISHVWREEVSRVWKTGFKAAVKLISVTTLLPILAMVLSEQFCSPPLAEDRPPATIFTSLQYFNVIRQPLMFFLLVAGAWADSAVALGRIGQFLLAEEQDELYTIHPEAELAIDADSDFTWETVHDTASASAEGQPDVTKNPNKSGEPTPPAGEKTKESEAGQRPGGGEKEGEKRRRGWFGRKGQARAEPV
ncbi:hypothetical protein FOMPIDRAFT_110493 [Fomitopsis schrenkii]|uniref:ABC transmembrane type-1 domain-containing protein n=1 Tax=Fomitopsis schrenkii TaxID=2126942 RepID=S8EKT5_FOMSC|nr:hypothetical protein FOMPIDRAFT_110493 [Fomitopsis schrenkii]